MVVRGALLLTTEALSNGSSSVAVKAVTAAQLSMASQNVYSVTLDEAIEAMRLTAADMSVKYKETSLSVRRCLTPLTLFLTSAPRTGIGCRYLYPFKRLPC